MLLSPITNSPAKKISKYSLKNRTHITLSSLSEYISMPTKPLLSDIIHSLSIQQEYRSLLDLANIYTYIINSHLTTKFINDNLDETVYSNLIVSSLPSAKLINLSNANSIVYKSGDIAECFYILLKGEINLQIPVRHTIPLSGYEYYRLIKSLKLKGDNYLLEKILAENISVFPINIEDVSIIESIFVRLLYTAQNPFNNNKEIGISKHNELNIEEILEISEVDYSYFDINKDTKHADIESKVLSKIKEAPLCLCDSYSFLRNKSTKQECIIYEYEDNSSVSEGYYFGEYNDDGTLIHKATTTINNCKILAFISLNYMDYVKKEKKKLIQDEISFLRDYFFFGSIYQQKFLRYFHFFTKENLVKGDILFREKKPIEYIYFLYEGQIEFTSERSIIDNHLLIQVLDGKIKGF